MITFGRAAIGAPRTTYAMRIDLDMPVSCADGAFGTLADVIIDPRTRRLTHIVVQPEDRGRRARLVATEHVRAADMGHAPLEGLVLDCTLAAIDGFESIQEAAFIRLDEVIETGPDWDVGIEEAFPVPDGRSLGPEILGAGVAMDYDQHVGVNYHRIPKGDAEIRRASAVTSTDGHDLGHVVGFVIDDDDQITELILEHGHLWGKRTVSVPARAITQFEIDELVLTLSRDEVGALKPLPGHR